MKIAANCKIKEKINNNRLIQKQALSSIEAQIVNSKWDHHHWK